MVEGELLYDERFTENVLIVGQTDCGKSTFVKNLAKNKMFGDIKKTEWISKIELTQKREKLFWRRRSRVSLSRGPSRL